MLSTVSELRSLMCLNNHTRKLPQSDVRRVVNLTVLANLLFTHSVMRKRTENGASVSLISQNYAAKLCFINQSINCELFPI